MCKNIHIALIMCFIIGLISACDYDNHSKTTIIGPNYYGSGGNSGGETGGGSGNGDNGGNNGGTSDNDITYLGKIFPYVTISNTPSTTRSSDPYTARITIDGIKASTAFDAWNKFWIDVSIVDPQTGKAMSIPSDKLANIYYEISWDGTNNVQSVQSSNKKNWIDVKNLNIGEIKHLKVRFKNKSGKVLSIKDGKTDNVIQIKRINTP
ncbi:hypothetical protein AGMMS50249_0630 [candidate division SR1 bacterium]|nr:hypothetical protein AGMMS50249_0630 [candidate division SR1 bacterium]